MLIKKYLKLISTIKIVVILKNNFNYYGNTTNNFYFCKVCYFIIIQKKISKFEFFNYIYILIHQKYLKIFNNLTFIKKLFIDLIYLIISIIKLKINNFNFFTLYS